MSDETEVVFDPQTDVDITGLEWWEVLQRLHRATRVPGPFALNRPLSNDAAIELIGRYVARNPREDFDYVLGRPIKVGFHTRYGQSFVRGVNRYDLDSPVPARVTIAALRQDKARLLRMVDGLPRRWS